jgi:hypothetical protein
LVAVDLILQLTSLTAAIDFAMLSFLQSIREQNARISLISSQLDEIVAQTAAVSSIAPTAFSANFFREDQIDVEKVRRGHRPAAIHIFPHIIYKHVSYINCF